MVAGCSRDALTTFLTTEYVFIELSHLLEAHGEHLQVDHLPLGSPDKSKLTIPVLLFGIDTSLYVRRDGTPRTNSAPTMFFSFFRGHFTRVAKIYANHIMNSVCSLLFPFYAPCFPRSILKLLEPNYL